MDSVLPTITGTRIELPKPVPRAASRVLNISKTSRSLRAVMPRGANPAPLTASRDYTLIPRQDRTSLASKIDALLNGAPLNTVDLDKIPNLVVLLKERKRKAILTGDYHISQKCEDLVRYVTAMSLQRGFGKIKKAEVAQLNNQLKSAESKLASIKAKWEQKVLEFNESQSTAARKLESDQLKKVTEFDESVPADLPPEYCKPSSALLNLREQERQLVLSKRYDEATALKKESDRMEKTEAEVQKRRFLSVINKRKEKLLKRQEHDRDCFTIRWQRQEEKLNKEMETEIRTQEKVVQNLILKIKDAESEEIMA